MRRSTGAQRTLAADLGADAETPAEPQPCSPCRGTGQLISNLGGEPSTLPCPWCEGTGVQIPGHDAQAARREGGAAEGGGAGD
jgi:DnaJ-class molecular chaperone